VIGLGNDKDDPWKVGQAHGRPFFWLQGRRRIPARTSGDVTAPRRQVPGHGGSSPLGAGRLGPEGHRTVLRHAGEMMYFINGEWSGYKKFDWGWSANQASRRLLGPRDEDPQGRL